MAKTDKELDDTIARARKNLAASKALIMEVDAAREEFEAWKEANGVNEEAVKKFTESLSGEGKARFDAEREELERQTRHDLEDIAARAKASRAKGVPAGGRSKRRRSYA